MNSSSAPRLMPGELALTTPINPLLALESFKSRIAPAPQALPEKLGHYRLQEKLGSGGMGAVYLAWDEQLHRHVAIKVLHSQDRANKESQDRLIREARAAAAISHDHVLSILHVGMEEEIFYLAMPRLRGVSLQTYIEKQGLPKVKSALRITRETALGLAAAHKLGVVHRDIKPSNLFLESPHARVKLLDFGVAKFVEAKTNSGLTEQGMVVGTPGFLSPEQARCHEIDGRSDLFSLGLVTYCMLTGQVPFARPSIMECLTALVEEEPAPVNQLNPNVPQSVVDLVHKLLEKKREDRPETAFEVAQRIERIEKQLTIHSGAILTASVVRTVPAEPPEARVVEEDIDLDSLGRKTKRRRKRAKFRRKNQRWAIITVISVLVSLLLVMGLWIWIISQNKPPAESAPYPGWKPGMPRELGPKGEIPPPPPRPEWER